MTFGRKIAWSTGAFGALMSMYAFSSFISFFYIDHLKMDPALFAIGMIVFGIWNAVNDPLIGHLSDNTRSRWGRRVPYVFLGALPLAAVFAIMWLPPHFAKAAESWTFIYFLVTVCLFDTVYTLVALNWTALYPEMYHSMGERTQMALMRQVFGMIGLAVGVALPPILTGSEAVGGWARMGLLLGGLTGLTLLISAFGSRERPESLRFQRLPLGASLKTAVGNLSFVTFGMANLAVNFSFSMLTGIFPFYAKYVLHVEGLQQSLMMGATFVSSLLLMPVWAKVTFKRGPRTVLASASIVLGLASIPYIFAKGPLMGLITNLLVGTGLAGLIPITDVAMADIVDEDETRTGVRREGMYFGLNGFFVRIAVALQGGVMGAILRSTGFDAKRAVQSPEAIMGLRAIISPLVIISLLVALIMLWAYPLHGRRLEQVQDRQSALRKARYGGVV